VLELRDIAKHYPAVGGETVRAVDGVSQPRTRDRHRARDPRDPRLPRRLRTRSPRTAGL